eukprot:TRINITY_DN59888_c0_g1_i1.p1 TRINITY_DN59888_c0_g1~~TRINITY_DN59888_c0_g1_i1.p1  ORF type:complete len:457 (+),score=186.57 TRINITY_DN59888_c0_g1_i1:70-1440(+)
MSGWVETARQAHEDIERHLAELTSEVVTKPTNPRHRIHHEHFLSQRVEMIRGKKRKLLELYNLPEAKRRDVQPSSVVEQSFFDRLREIRAYHEKFPDQKPELHAPQRPAPDTLPVKFSGEECYGQCLDLHGLYQQFMRLPCNYELKEAANKQGYTALRAAKVKPIDYLNWVKRCTLFQYLPIKAKNGDYREYLENMLAYLTDWHRRTQPLSPAAEQLLSEVEGSFPGRWERKEVLGWQEVSGQAPPTGGKLTKGQRRAAHYYRLALLEDKVRRLYEMLDEAVQATVRYIDRKETMTRTELDKEEYRAQEQAAAAMLGEEPPKKDGKSPLEAALWNPLKLPLGWDGKPIPYWLYRLHGLSMKYPCEICGCEYVGPKMFDKHFQESQHAQGMRRLRIPNTRHFHHVTRIVDAQALWHKLKHDTAWRQWRPDNEQEFEDSEGHVFNKKTFDDMRRQGLI